MSEESKNTATFAGYGTVFQEQIVQALLVDRPWAEAMSEVFKPEYFELKHLEYLSSQYFEYARKYKSFPTLTLLVTKISEELKGSDKLLRDQVIDYLKRVRGNPNPGDLPFVKERALDFCKRQALKSALEKSVDLINTEKYEAVVDIVKRAVMSGMSTTVGHDFAEDHEARFQKMSRHAVPTGLDQLDAKDVLNGGAGKGELCCVMAPSGVGKCTIDREKVVIRYAKLKINGKLYKPWDRVSTRRGEIFARDIRQDDELV